MSLRQAANNRQLGVVVAVAATAVGFGTEGTFLGHRYDRDLVHIWSQQSLYADIDGSDRIELSETRKKR